MTSSKFQELLDGPTHPHSRPSSSHELPQTNRFPIDGEDAVPNPSRNSSKKVLRKLSGEKPIPLPLPSPAFSGPDADFDFGGRERVQRIEPESPTHQEEKQEQRDLKEKLSSKSRRRLRKLSIALSGH